MAHPYVPRGLRLPGYQANNNTIPEILGAFFVPVFLMASTVAVLVGQKIGIRAERKVAMTWLCCSGVIHIVLEGYFGVFNASFVKKQDLLAQIWKEYAKADSRYVSQNTFVWFLESWTAFVVGPLCIMAFLAFMKDWPSRYFLQIMASMFQLYGTLLYLVPEFVDGFKFNAKPYDLQYFWFYFVFLNGLWILVPTLLIIDSCSAIREGQKLLDAINKPTKKRQ